MVYDFVLAQAAEAEQAPESTDGGGRTNNVDSKYSEY